MSIASVVVQFGMCLSWLLGRMSFSISIPFIFKNEKKGGEQGQFLKRKYKKKKVARLAK